MKSLVNYMLFDDNYINKFLLNKFVIIKVTGKDSKKYLNSQITANLNILKNNNYLISGHCNFNGKLLGILKIFKNKDNQYFYIIRKNLYKDQIKIFKKYSIFSKVYFFKKKFYFLGILEKYFKKSLLKFFFIELPNKKKKVIISKNFFIILDVLPKKRFLFILSKKFFIRIKIFFQYKIIFLDQNQWDILDIVSNIPILSKKFCGYFYPQELNLNKIKNSISFEKGCFHGQEMISKIKYLGRNNKKLIYLFSKNYYKKKFLKLDVNVFLKKKKEFYKQGIVLKIIRFCSNKFIAQVVLKNFNKKNKFYYIQGFKFITISKKYFF